MKRITTSLDWMAGATLTVGVICLMAGFLAVGFGALAGNGQFGTAGMAMIGGGSLIALLSACWVHRDF